MPQSFAEEFSAIPMSTHLGQSLERAHRFAREQSHKAVTLEHLLLALTEDTEAALILEAANIELGKLSTEVSGYLGRMPEDMRGDGGAEPRPDGELLRVLQAAASAAKQSRRKQIDGAIVLAAVVGDGKTPAAGLLPSPTTAASTMAPSICLRLDCCAAEAAACSTRNSSGSGRGSLPGSARMSSSSRPR